MGASPSTNEGNGAVSAASLFQVGDRVRFVHGREYDEVTRDHNRDYEVVDFYPNNLVQIRPIGDQGVGCAAIPTNLYKIQQHGFNNGDIVILPIKRTRKQLKENFPEPPEYWVIVDASDCNKIAITRFSSAFDGLEDFTKTKPITWSYRQSHEIRDTGFNIFSYREKCEQATENLRQQHDLILIPTNSRYVEKKDLDQLIAIAVQFFKGKGYEANYAGYTQGRWQVCVFLQNGDSVGSLLFDALPDFEDPNQNSPWFGGYKDFYWRADDELESEIYACDLISDLEKLALPLESERAKTDLFGEPDPFQEAWLEKDNQLAIDDRNPFADKTAEDFGRVATAAN